VPPLAEREADILPLAEHFLVTDQGAGKHLSLEAREALCRHTWPGNVRELRNALKRAVLLARGDEITAVDLRLPSAPSSLSSEQLDREALELALARAGGVVAQAASDLGLSRQALYRRMEKLGIERH
jgi:DNA-binding NtrC family response regulator